MPLEVAKSSLLVICAGCEHLGTMFGHRYDVPRVVSVLAWPCGVIRWGVAIPDFTALWVFRGPGSGQILLVDISWSVPFCKYVEEA